MSSLARAGFYWSTFAIAALGAPTPAQQALKAAKPSEQITVRGAKMTWAEMLQIQASLPELANGIEAPRVTTIELPPTEVQLPGRSIDIKNRRELPADGVAKTVVSCTGFSVEPAI